MLIEAMTMKTFVLSVVLILLASCGVRAAGADLIANSSFEGLRRGPFLSRLPKETRALYGGCVDSPSQGWAFGGNWDNGKYTVHVSDDAHTGKRSAEIRCGKKGRGGVASSPFKLMPGTIIKVSFWVKARNADGGRVFLNYEGTPGDGWNRMDIPAGTYGWTQITHRCVVPARRTGADGQTLVLFFYSKAGGSIWLDDVTAETVDVNAMAEAPAAPALLAPTPKAIPEPAGSIGYRIDVASTLAKALPDTDYKPAAQLRSSAAMSLARNEHEGVQVVIEAPWRDVTVQDIALSDLRSDNGNVLSKDALRWWRVDFVETTITPLYPVDRVGWYPDPLMPAGKFTVKRLSRVPVWVSLHAPKDTPAGVYRGTITVQPKGLKPTAVPLTVTVYDFTLSDETHLRTMTWLGMGSVSYFYGHSEWAKRVRKAGGKINGKEIVERFEDILLEHRLGPGGQVTSAMRDFRRSDARLERLIKKGMNAFIMSTAPNLKRRRQNEYSREFIEKFAKRVKAYGDHLRKKGWLDKAYVYTYDEAPKKHWGEVKKIAAAVKRAAPELRILQCLNQPKGVKALAGHVDVFDVYIQQYHQTGVAAMQKQGTEAWLAICCYPSSHPNLFIEYPLIDARIAPLFCWKYKAAGFEYWSPVAWGRNWRKEGEDQWPNAPWDPNTFGRYNGDGYLLYPGPKGIPYPSIRLKALRDGFEDYEYLWQLDQLVKRADAVGKRPPEVGRARALLKMNDLITDAGDYRNTETEYLAFRKRVAQAIVRLRKLLGG